MRAELDPERDLRQEREAQRYCDNNHRLTDLAAKGEGKGEGKIEKKKKVALLVCFCVEV